MNLKKLRLPNKIVYNKKTKRYSCTEFIYLYKSKIKYSHGHAGQNLVYFKTQSIYIFPMRVMERPSDNG